MPDGSGGGMFQATVTILTYAFWLKSFCGGSRDLKGNPNSSQPRTVGENCFLLISGKIKHQLQLEAFCISG